MADTPLSAERRLRLLRRMAWIGAALMLVTITLSAYMRLSQAGLGCADWPACYAQNLRASPQDASALGGHGVAVARLAHRVVASAMLVLVIVMVMTALATRPALKRAGALAAALLGLALALAVLGIATPGARKPAVAMGNLLGGFVMLALCVRLAATGPPRAAAPTAPARLGGWAVAALALLCAQLAGGAVLLGLVATQVALGLLIVSSSLPLAGVLLHNLLAALLLATVVRLI